MPLKTRVIKSCKFADAATFPRAPIEIGRQRAVTERASAKAFRPRMVWHSVRDHRRGRPAELGDEGERELANRARPDYMLVSGFGRTSVVDTDCGYTGGMG